jgi:hypothetical protein
VPPNWAGEKIPNRTIWKSVTHFAFVKCIVDDTFCRRLQQIQPRRCDRRDQQTLSERKYFMRQFLTSDITAVAAANSARQPVARSLNAAAAESPDTARLVQQAQSFAKNHGVTLPTDRPLDSQWVSDAMKASRQATVDDRMFLKSMLTALKVI